MSFAEAEAKNVRDSTPNLHEQTRRRSPQYFIIGFLHSLSVEENGVHLACKGPLSYTFTALRPIKCMYSACRNDYASAYVYFFSMPYCRYFLVGME